MLVRSSLGKVKFGVGFCVLCVSVCVSVCICVCVGCFMFGFVLHNAVFSHGY